MMRRRSLRWTLAATLLLAGGCTSDSDDAGRSPSDVAVTTLTPTEFAGPVTAQLPFAQRRALQSVLDGVVSDNAVTPAAGARGITAAVVSDHGSWAGAAGTDGISRPLEPESMMAIDSITKTFVAAEVLKLAEAGEVELDDPLATYVRHPLTANGATVRQTLSMRSGVEDPSAPRWVAVLHAQQHTPREPWPLRKTLSRLRARSSPPGGAPVYANTNYLLLGLLIETVTGRPLAEVERTELFEPAGLRRIAAQDSERPTPPLAAASRRIVPRPDGYLPSRSWARIGHDSYAGIAADAATVATWGYQLYGGRLLDPSSVTSMVTEPSIENISPGVGYALGTQVFGGLSTDVVYGHSGVDPGFTSILVFVPLRHLAVAVLVPEGGRPVESFTRDLLAVVQ